MATLMGQLGAPGVRFIARSNCRPSPACKGLEGSGVRVRSQGNVGGLEHGGPYALRSHVPDSPRLRQSGVGGTAPASLGGGSNQVCNRRGTLPSSLTLRRWLGGTYRRRHHVDLVPLSKGDLRPAVACPDPTRRGSSREPRVGIGSSESLRQGDGDTPTFRSVRPGSPSDALPRGPSTLCRVGGQREETFSAANLTSRTLPPG